MAKRDPWDDDFFPSKGKMALFGIGATVLNIVLILAVVLGIALIVKAVFL